MFVLNNTGVWNGADQTPSRAKPGAGGREDRYKYAPNIAQSPQKAGDTSAPPPAAPTSPAPLGLFKGLFVVPGTEDQAAVRHISLCPTLCPRARLRGSGGEYHWSYIRGQPGIITGL